MRRYELLKAYIEDEIEGRWGRYLLRCWQIASRPMCEKRSFGAVLVIGDKIVGEGQNKPRILD
jgi:deoxycytidylate deaminase